MSTLYIRQGSYLLVSFCVREDGKLHGFIQHSVILWQLLSQSYVTLLLRLPRDGAAFPMGRSWESCICSAGEDLGEFHQCVQTPEWVGANVKAGSLQWCPEAMGTNRSTGGTLWTAGSISVLCGRWSTGTGCQRLWGLLWQYLFIYNSKFYVVVV